MKRIGAFEIVQYHYNGKDIIIEKVKVLDEYGKYIKFARLADVLPFLSSYPVKFKQLKVGGKMKIRSDVNFAARHYASQITDEDLAEIYRSKPCEVLSDTVVLFLVRDLHEYEMLVADVDFIPFLRQATKIPNLTVHFRYAGD